MSEFNKAIPVTLAHEGGFVNDPADPGGATNHGITQKDLDETRSSYPDFPTNVKDLTAEQAAHWYETTTKPERFNNPLYWQINDQDVATKVFDLGVLFGVGKAVKILQIVLGNAYPEFGAPDEVFGPKTLEYVNKTDPISLLNVYKTAFVAYALRIAANRPSERKFVAGWGHRINS